MPREMLAKYRDNAVKVAVVVQAKDGRWSFGLNEAKLAAQAKGDFDTPEAARDAAAKEFDIILNTAAPVAKTRAKRIPLRQRGPDPEKSVAMRVEERAAAPVGPPRIEPRESLRVAAAEQGKKKIPLRGQK